MEIAEVDASGFPAGPEALRIEVSGIAVEYQGLPQDAAGAMRAHYGPFLGPPTGAGRPLRVEVRRAEVDYFVPPGFTRGPEDYRMLTAHDGRIFRTTSYRLASWIDVAARRGVVAFGRGELDPPLRAFENFLRSAVAWLAIDAGGFFLHGAGIVRGGSAFLFYGPSGAGKSTLAALSDEGTVISDDLTLLLRSGGRLVASGGPFRGTYTRGAAVTGLFPIAGFYRLRKSDVLRVAPDNGGCFADLLGNLPFVVDQLPRLPHLIDTVRAAVAGERFRYLHFRKDVPFWPAIDAELRSPAAPPAGAGPAPPGANPDTR
jgi:hypothetical protein